MTSRNTVTLPINDVQVNNGCYCTQLTYRVQNHVGGRDSSRNGRYEIIDNCTGTKVVNIIAGPQIYKFHDGCLGRVSHELAQMTRISSRIVIENAFAQSTALALNYVLKPFRVTTITSREKYDLVLFGARHGLPPRHISRLIDRSIYADLIAYAWHNNNSYLMTMLPKLRIPGVELDRDVINLDYQTRRMFIRTYLEHEHRLKKYGRIRIYIILGVLGTWFLLLFCAILFDKKWTFPERRVTQSSGIFNRYP
uniref:Recep_L_domain domain-containing protein n=1 Tax=Panagrellus redivivus TaxID=6233 RepID=A0A7E4ZYB4_PANRE